jgi:hypothetical protein
VIIADFSVRYAEMITCISLVRRASDTNDKTELTIAADIEVFSARVNPAFAA